MADVTEFVGACYDRDTILDVLMGFSARWFPARMVLIVGRGWVQMFAADGFPLPQELDKSMRRAEVDPDAPAIKFATATGSVEEVGLGELFGQLGLEDPLVRTVGVSIGQRVAIVLVGTIDDEHAETDDLEESAETAGKQLEDLIRMAKADELPPPDQRIPPFPVKVAEIVTMDDELIDDGSTRRVPSAPPQGRKTQQLSEVSDAGAATLSAPRLPSAIEESESEVESEDAGAEANATSFGLPFSKQATRKAPSPEDMDTTDRGTPGVSLLPPQNVGDDNSHKTKLGGLSAEPDLMADLAADDQESEAEHPSTMIGSPVSSEPTRKAPVLDEPTRKATALDEPTRKATVLDSDEVHRTQLGGLQGETRLVSESLGRHSSVAEEQPPEKPESKDADDDHDAWMSARTKSGMPAAMILKPASRKKRRKAAQKAAADEAKTDAAKPAASKDDGAAKADDEIGHPPGTVATDQKKSPVQRSSELVDDSHHSQPISAATHDSEPEQVMAGNQTAFGAQWSHAEEPTRRVDAGDGIDDAWFDYFADIAEDQSPNSAAEVDKMDFDLADEDDEPHSLPPETLEALLESGPQMVDMQEQFLILDSRDRDKAFEAAEAVTALGDTAVEILDLMFPGRIFLDRYQFVDSFPPVSEHGPVLHALVRLGDPAVRVARHHMTEQSNETRFYAVFLLTRLNAEPALGELYERLFDKDQQIRRIASEIVVDYQTAGSFDRLILKPLRTELSSTDDLHVATAAQLLGTMRDRDGVGVLIDALERTHASRPKQSIMTALRQVTLHNWSSPYEWNQWWESAQEERREEWIVEALNAPDDVIRVMAHEEIQRIPGLDLNYHPDQPVKLRKRAQGELRDWFEARASD